VKSKVKEIGKAKENRDKEEKDSLLKK